MESNSQDCSMNKQRMSDDELEQCRWTKSEGDSRLFREAKRARKAENKQEARIAKLCASIDERGVNEAKLAVECVKLEKENEKLKEQIAGKL